MLGEIMGESCLHCHVIMSKMRCKNANGFEPAPARLLSGTMTVVLDDRYHTGSGRLHRDMWEWKQAGNRIRANAPHSS